VAVARTGVEGHDVIPTVTEDGTSRAGDTVHAMHNDLREAIIRGELQPGAAVTSVEVAERFGVSRTPAREALRMLQEEGFLRGESNQRLRVVEWSADELTVPTLTDADIAHMEQLLRSMQAARDDADHDAWRLADVAFHHVHMQGASTTLRADLARLYERASMFRAIWLRNRDQTLSFSMDDHPDILQACRTRDPELGGIAAARHLTRVALTLMTELAPDHEPAIVRQALRLAGLDGASSSKPAPTRRRSNGAQKPSTT